MQDEFKTNLLTNIFQNSFPCVMAKAVAKKGFFHTFSIPDLSGSSVECSLNKLQTFVDEMNSRKAGLSSCAMKIDDNSLRDFKLFEKKFWPFLKALNNLDKKNYAPDPTVDADPKSNNFSFSIKSEAFFIIVLHPESPRWARRFVYPTIVFNPHRQFEEMRTNGTYMKVRNLIRMKDKALQGTINPMLQNFGEKSEVYQYLGVNYSDTDPVPLNF